MECSQPTRFLQIIVRYWGCEICSKVLLSSGFDGGPLWLDLYTPYQWLGFMRCLHKQPVFGSIQIPETSDHQNWHSEYRISILSTVCICWLFQVKIFQKKLAKKFHTTKFRLQLICINASLKITWVYLQRNLMIIMKATSSLNAFLVLFLVIIELVADNKFDSERHVFGHLWWKRSTADTPVDLECGRLSSWLIQY